MNVSFYLLLIQTQILCKWLPDGKFILNYLKLQYFKTPNNKRTTKFIYYEIKQQKILLSIKKLVYFDNY